MQFLTKWVVWRLVPVATWGCLLAALVQLFNPHSLPRWIWFLLLIPVVSLALTAVCNSPWKSLQLLATISIFPFLAIGWLVWKLYSPAKGMVGTYVWITSPIMAVLYIVSIVLNWVVITAMEDETTVIILSVTFSFINWLVILCSIKWAISPVNVLNLGIAVANMVLSELQKNHEKEAQKDIESRVKHANSMLKMWEYATPALAKLNKDPASAIAVVFVMFFMFLIFLTVVNHSFSYYKIHQVSTDYFEGMGGRFIDSLLYSFSVITTSPIGTVKTAWLTDQFIYCSELACTILLVTLFVSMFSIGVSLQQNVIGNFKESVESLKRWRDDHTLLCNSYLAEFQAYREREGEEGVKGHIPAEADLQDSETSRVDDATTLPHRVTGEPPAPTLMPSNTSPEVRDDNKRPQDSDMVAPQSVTSETPQPTPLLSSTSPEVRDGIHPQPSPPTTTTPLPNKIDRHNAENKIDSGGTKKGRGKR